VQRLTLDSRHPGVNNTRSPAPILGFGMRVPATERVSFCFTDRPTRPGLFFLSGTVSAMRKDAAPMAWPAAHITAKRECDMWSGTWSLTHSLLATRRWSRVSTSDSISTQ
jgi:hypothetical protein